MQSPLSRFLTGIKQLFSNGPQKAQYLNGNNLGMVSSEVNCTDDQSQIIFGLSDETMSFRTLTKLSVEASSAKAAIIIPHHTVCKSKGIYAINHF